jgi:hypothetical protein
MKYKLLDFNQPKTKTGGKASSFWRHYYVICSGTSGMSLLAVGNVMEFREHSRLPNHRFASKNFHAFSRIGGPGGDSPDTLRDPSGKEVFSAKSFSTLASSSLAALPLSHRYFCSFFEDKVLMALADGGLAGSSSVEAAERALVGFLDYMHG